MAAPQLPSIDGRVRAIIEAITPSVDGGRFPIKRVIGDQVVVEADCFTDGHDELGCLVLHRHADEKRWSASPMERIGNDRWRGVFTVEKLGSYRYTVTAWVDAFLSWRHDFERRVDAEDLRVAARVGADLIDGAAERARGEARRRLAEWSQRLRAEEDITALKAIGVEETLATLAARYPDRSLESVYPTELIVTVDRERARYSTWYELFPRS